MRTVLVVLLMALAVTGCSPNKAQMKPDSSKIMTDEQGARYIVRHWGGEIYRVEKLEN